MMLDKLAYTVTAFQHWRSNKPSKCTATPHSLRLQAVELLPDYSLRTVAKKLQITSDQLKQWQLTLQPSQDVTHFVSLPVLPHEQLPSLAQPLSFDVSLANGNQFSVSGALNNQLIMQLIGAIKL